MKNKHLTAAIIVLCLALFSCSQKDRFTSNAIGMVAVVETESQASERNEVNENKQLENSFLDSVTKVILLFQSRDIEKIATKIQFPLYREYPIPSIKNKEEFRNRFSEVFDAILIDKIASSKPEQWSEVGWRGVMLENGVLWMANSDGVITSVNYQSDFEKKVRQELIAKDKQNLHLTLKSFESPIYRIKTKNYLIRIDELSNGEYRYASWKIGEKESSKPSIILNKGEWEFEGSGGNHLITFVNGNYVYKIYRNLIGEKNSPDITLYVEKNGQNIVTEDGMLMME